MALSRNRQTGITPFGITAFEHSHIPITNLNQAHAQISGIFGDFPGWITGVIFAAVVFAVIVGGIKSIAQVTEKVVPFMGIMYVGVALLILLLNYDKIGWAIGQVFEGIDFTL